jgi:hypothetical protein
MNKTEQAKYDAAIVMAKTANDRANKLEAALEEQEDTRPFEIMVQKIDRTDKYLLVATIEGKVFSAGLVRRNKTELISTKDFVHSHNETSTRKDVQEVLDRKARYDALATNKNVASQGDVPSAS